MKLWLNFVFHCGMFTGTDLDVSPIKWRCEQQLQTNLNLIEQSKIIVPIPIIIGGNHPLFTKDWQFNINEPILTNQNCMKSCNWQYLVLEFIDEKALRPVRQLLMRPIRNYVVCSCSPNPTTLRRIYVTCTHLVKYQVMKE